MPLTLAEHAMGTRFELVLSGGSDAALRTIGEEALREVTRWHQVLSAFDRASVVSQLNREAANRPVRVERQVIDLLQLCCNTWWQSDGAFDPTIGGAMQRLGFHPGEPGAPLVDLRPPSFADVEVDRNAGTVRFTRPDVRLDFGAVGKGWAVDRAAEILHEHGVASALLHGGTSSVIAIGAPPDAHGWRIAIRGRSETTLVVELHDIALGVSAPRGRVIESDTGTQGHIIDPRTGRPSDMTPTPTAAVIGASAAECDAWSTALVVLGMRPGTMPHGLTSAIESCSDKWAIEGPGESLFSRRVQEVSAA